MRSTPFTLSSASAQSLLFILLLNLSITMQGHAAEPQKNQQTITSATWAYRIIDEQPHTPASFIQGWQLSQDGNSFYESSGLYGKSFIIQYDRNNKPLQRKQLPSKVFAEGLAELNGKLYVLSWKSRTAYVFNSRNFSPITQHSYKGEGWGLTHNQHELIMSNGSNTLTFLEPSTFTPKRTISISDGSQKHWKKLNELEFAHGLIWANIWQEPTILAINPSNGSIQGIINLASLVRANTTTPHHETLNGIAYDPIRKGFWVTGKLWKKRYLIEIITPEGQPLH